MKALAHMEVQVLPHPKCRTLCSEGHANEAPLGGWEGIGTMAAPMGRGGLAVMMAAASVHRSGMRGDSHISGGLVTVAEAASAVHRG